VRQEPLERELSVDDEACALRLSRRAEGPRTVEGQLARRLSVGPRRRRSPSSGSLPTGASRNASPGRSRATRMRRSPGLRRATVSCSASQKALTCRCGPSHFGTGRRRHSAASTRRIRPTQLFHPMGIRRPTRARNGASGRSTSSHSQPLGSRISSSRKGPTLRTIRAGRRTEKSCSTTRISRAPASRR